MLAELCGAFFVDVIKARIVVVVSSFEVSCTKPYIAVLLVGVILCNCCLIYDVFSVAFTLQRTVGFHSAVTLIVDRSHHLGCFFSIIFYYVCQ